MKDQDWITFLEEEHKIKSDIWKKHGLHFDDEFLYFPYRNKGGRIEYEKRRRTPNFKGDGKYLYGGGDSAKLWPYWDLSEHPAWIVTEGELDQLTAESYGLPAVTSGGVNSFKRHFTDNFKGKKAYICFDTDKAGKTGAERLAQIFLEAGVEVYIIDLPEMENGKDIGDFFRLGNTRNDFLKLVKKARKQTLENEEDTRQKKKKIELIETPLTYAQVEEKVLLYLPNSKIGLRLVLAVAVSCIFPNQVMLWLLFVGVPSSGKTDLVRLVKETETTYFLDNLTPNAFISGERETERKAVFDLLPELHNKCLIIKDWTSIFSLDEKITKKLLGDLVGIYDQEFSKFSSSRGFITYTSSFSQLGCITPATLNKHTGYMNMVGPRFLCYIIPQLTREEKDKNYEMVFSNIDRKVSEIEAKLYVASYLTQLTKKPFNIKPLKKEIQLYLKTATDLMANCRGTVIMQSSGFKNEKDEYIKYYEVLEIQVEEPWRAVQQLKGLVTFLAFVAGRDEVNIEDLSIIKEIVLSSMPADRSQAIRAIKEHNGIITAKELSGISEKSHKTSLRLLDELVALKVIEKIKGSGSAAADYILRNGFKNFILFSPSEFLSSYSNETETSDGTRSVVQENLFTDVVETKN